MSRPAKAASVSISSIVSVSWLSDVLSTEYNGPSRYYCDRPVFIPCRFFVDVHYAAAADVRNGKHIEANQWVAESVQRI